MDLSPENILFIVLLAFALVGLTFFVITDLMLLIRTRRLKHAQELAITNQRWEQEVNRSRTEAVNQVLKDISSELHDNVGQMLSLAVIQLNRLEMNLSGQHEEPINEVKDSLRLALKEVRNLSHSVSRLQEQPDLELSLRELHEKLQNTGWQVWFDLKLGLTELHFDQQVILLRIIQELIQNSLKHADSKRINLSLQQESGVVILHYNDHGSNWNGLNSSNQDGMGLKLIIERLEILQAQWQFSASAPFELNATIPILNKHETHPDITG